MNPRGSESGEGGHFAGFDLSGQGRHFQGQPKVPNPEPQAKDPTEAESENQRRLTRRDSPRLLRARYVFLGGVALALLVWLLYVLFRMVVK